MVSKLLLSAGIALAPMLCLAQSTPGLYIGASASMFSADPFRPYNANTFGPALTVGYQLSPRWAIQSGASLFWRNSSYSVDYYDTPSTSYIYSQITSDLHSNLLLIPVLARYTFTDPANPLHVDALFGASWLHATYRSTATYYLGTNVGDTNTLRSSDNSINANVGPSIRYTLGAHLDLMANSVLQIDLGSGYNHAGSNFGDRLSLNTQLGVQYNFGK